MFGWNLTQDKENFTQAIEYMMRENNISLPQNYPIISISVPKNPLPLNSIDGIYQLLKSRRNDSMDPRVLIIIICSVVPTVSGYSWLVQPKNWNLRVFWLHHDDHFLVVTNHWRMMRAWSKKDGWDLPSEDSNLNDHLKGIKLIGAKRDLKKLFITPDSLVLLAIYDKGALF